MKNARAATITVYKAAVAAAGTVVQAVSTASSAVAEFAQDNWRTLVGVGAGLAVAVGCSVLTAGVGTAACLIAGAAVAGALSNSLNCQPGRSVAGCAARGAAAGAVGGGVIVTALASGAGAAASDAVGQAITTGHVDGTEVATSGALGAVLGGAGAKLRAGCGKCFAKGTKVLTTKGRKAIEKIRTGDVVWARNPITGKNVRAKVIGTMQRTATAMMVITVAGTALTVTTEHPFHTADRGWVQSDKLDVGDTLDLSNGKTATIQTVARYSAPTTVYNFTVKGEHNYFAGPAGVLVHNSGGACQIPRNLPARDIRFTQNNIGANFKNGDSVLDMADQMASGGYPEGMPPLRVFAQDGNVHSLDNRRLVAAQMAGINVPVVPASARDIARRNQTQVLGGTGIMMRQTGRWEVDQ